MSSAVSTSTGKPYGVKCVCRAWESPRSSVYARRKADCRSPDWRPAKRGPKTQYSDEVLTGHIRKVIDESPWLAEGHRKVWARLKFEEIRTSKKRTLDLMREANLLAPSRAGRVLGPRNHDGSITTDRPDEMWGTDFTTTHTTADGQVAVFIAVDHCTSEGIGIHASKKANRFEAMEPIRQGVRAYFGGYDKEIAKGLKIRHDNGTQYVAEAFQTEMEWLGIETSPAFVRAPEGNGCAERFIRTLKEQLLWVRRFRTVDELQTALRDWINKYNERWLVARHGYQTPAQIRHSLLEVPRGGMNCPELGGTRGIKAIQIGRYRSNAEVVFEN